MLTPEEKKWIDEGEITERYILGQLDPGDKNRFEQLLTSDEELRNELEFEAMTIAAIRQYSRTELKKRIRESLKQSRPAPAMTIQKSAGTGQAWMYIRAAAVILLFLGGIWLFYQWMYGDQSPAPIGEDKEKKQEPAKEKILLPPKQETISEYREPPKKEKIRKQVRNGRSEDSRRPAVLSMPADTAHSRSVQKFVADPALFPKPNEVKTTIDLIDETRQAEIRILFKNPTDLSAVDITVPHEEQNETLQWFYVHYDNTDLNVYLDNTKYLNVFRSAKLIRQKETLLIHLEKTSYQVSLKDDVKFRKALLVK